MELKKKKCWSLYLGTLALAFRPIFNKTELKTLLTWFFCYYFEVNGVLFICFEILYVIKWLHFSGLALWTQLLSNSKKPGNSCSAATGRPFAESWGQRRGGSVKGTPGFPLLRGSSQLILKLRSRVRTFPHLLHILGRLGQSRFTGTPPLSLLVVTFHMLLIAFPH